MYEDTQDTRGKTWLYSDNVHSALSRNIDSMARQSTEPEAHDPASGRTFCYIYISILTPCQGVDFSPQQKEKPDHLYCKVTKLLHRRRKRNVGRVIFKSCEQRTLIAVEGKEHEKWVPGGFESQRLCSR